MVTRMARKIERTLEGEMKTLKCWFKSRPLLECNRGATAVEYAILLALIAAVIFTAVGLFGSAVDGLFLSAAKGW
jgi:Flp pilus assembly pilin Flp